MNKLRVISLVLAMVGVSVLLGSYAVTLDQTWWKWLPLGGGMTLFLSWFLVWKTAASETKSESEVLLRLRREIEQEAVKLEKERSVLRRERVVHFGLEETLEISASPSLVATAEDPAEWETLDAKVLMLMREESEHLFRNLLDNAYMESGEFDRSRLGDDLIRLIESIARVYQPESDHPLLETSVERLLRAANHASVQMLVHFEQLPLDVKSYNLRETYQYIRSGAKYYGYYKKVEPYWSYARPLYHLGRLAMGTNPITIGVGWAVSELIKQGSVNYAHSYALRLFHDTVRVLGNEAAGIFGSDYRHRDPAWIYGLEIVTLTRTFPESKSRLEAALREVAGLTLRSEYDRIFLYGCLAGRATPYPERFQGRDFLSLSERQQIAARIERHLRKQDMEKGIAKVAPWKKDVEHRLGVHLRIGEQGAEPTSQESVYNALRALASFLIQYKGMESKSLRDLLSGSATGSNASEEEFEEVWQSILSEPPMLYEIPVLGLGTHTLSHFLDDLLDCEAAHAPRFPESAEAIEETAGYFREDPAKWRAQLRARYAQLILKEVEQSHGSVKHFPDAAAPLVLGLLGEGESVSFFYEDIAIASDEEFDGIVDRDRVLCATERRLLLIATSGEQSDLVWSGEKGDVMLERVKGVVADDCKVSGGRWFIDAEAVPRAIIVAGHNLKSYEKRFGRLVGWLG